MDCGASQQAVASQLQQAPLGMIVRCTCHFTRLPQRKHFRSVQRSEFFNRTNSRTSHDHLSRSLEAAAAESSAMSPDQGPPSEQLQVFPRLRERDPYRRLGVTRDASFEEVEGAKQFLLDQYRWHASSRESIELAYDDILSEHFKRRNKYGFRPIRTGRKTDVAGDPERFNVIKWALGRLDPAVSKTTLVNDGSIFLGLSIWTSLQAAVDPTLPLGAAMAFCVWRLFEKRKKTNPEGPYWGGNPIWGALLTTLGGLMFGGVLSWAVSTYIPFPPSVNAPSIMLGFMTAILGATCIFLR